MIKVTVELLPGGSEEGKRMLGVMLITNTGTGDALSGNYVAALHAEYTAKSPRTALLRQFNRKSQSVWSLIGGFLKHFGHTKHSPSLIGEAKDEEQPTNV